MKNLLIASLIGAVVVAIVGIKLSPMNRSAEAALVSQNTAAPALTGKSWLNSKPISFESRRGKVTIVGFLKSTEASDSTTYAKLLNDFRTKEVEVLGVYLTNAPAKATNFVKESGISYPVLVDNDEANAKRWKLQIWPTLYLVDKQGNIRYKTEGKLDAEGAAQLSEHIQLLSKEIGEAPSVKVPAKIEKITKTDEQWRAQLSPAAYDVLRHEGTEPAGSSPLAENHENGTFICAGCGLPLFSSKTKFESGTGWPSFYQPLSKNVVIEKTDYSFGMSRTAVECARCGGHLGHVFNDGPRPTGLRYCMNGVALNFVKSAQ